MHLTGDVYSPLDAGTAGRRQVMRQREPMRRADDETVIKEIDDWEISFSVSEKALYIDTVSYHPPRLKLSRDDLKELLDTIDTMSKAG
jgi:hypothetical protein